MLALIASATLRTVGLTLGGRLGRFGRWPKDDLLIDEPLALAEERTSRLQRIYDKCAANLWDGPAVFREAVAQRRHRQLDPARRRALARVISTLMWGELAAWIISAELAERLEDPDARMAASSQVFDEARHFYVLRDYAALLHVPVPRLEPYFVAALRELLSTRDLLVKLLAMQILAEGTAQAIFQFLAEAEVEPVLSELLPYIERDEARHVGLGVLYLPQHLRRLSPAECRRIADRVYGIGDLMALSAVQSVSAYQALGLDPRQLFRRADRMLCTLAAKLGTVPGTGQPYLRTDDPDAPGYERKLEILFPEAAPSPIARTVRALIDLGGRWLPA